MEIYTDEEAASAIIAEARAMGVEAQIVGRCVAAPAAAVRIIGEHGTFVYHR
jgi:hypothetical protein